MPPQNQNSDPQNQADGAQTNTPQTGQPANNPQIIGQQQYNAQPYVTSPNPSPAKKRRRLPKIFLILLLVILLLGSGGGYAYWRIINNRPEKILADALSNTMSDFLDRKPTTTIGSIVYESKSEQKYTVTIDFDAKQANNNFETGATLRFEGYGTDFSLKGAVIVIDTKKVYVKFENLQKTVQDVAALSPGFQPWADALQPLIQKIDGHWINIDSESAAETGFADSQEIDTCSEAFRNLRIRPEDKGKIKDIFSRNQFAIATEKLAKEHAGDEESYHYKLDLNERAGVTFTRELVDLRSFGTLKKDCGIDHETFDRQLKAIEEDSDNKTPQPVVELWVGTSTRLPTRFRVTMEEKELTTTFDTAIKVNAKNIDIKPPGNTMPFTEILSEIEALSSSLIGTQDTTE